MTSVPSSLATKQDQKFTFGVLFAVCGFLGGCGFHPPMTAEKYDPMIHADHQVDLTSVEVIADLYQIMKDSHEVFKKCELLYWADSGTLLGAVRNKGIIPWDDDNDIAVPADQVTQFLLLRSIFDDLGYFIEKAFFGYRIVKPGTSVAVDIFVMKEGDEKFYYDRGDWGNRDSGPIFIKQEEVFPLKEVDFGPIKVMVPNHPNLYLDSLYRNWQTTAFTYGHAGQRKFKIDLVEYRSLLEPAPLESGTLQQIDIRDRMKDRVSPTLECPVLDKGQRLPFPVFFDGV